jgi:tartrate-resistant acid phosphatase type 5
MPRTLCRSLTILILASALGCGHLPGAKTPEAASPAVPATDVCGPLLAEDQPPPPPPAVLPANRPVRVLAFGDFGDGGLNQKRVAAGMAEQDRRHPFDLGITVGDNFYPQGLDDVSDPRWERDWEMLYTPLKIRVYATYGNHDHYDVQSPEAEIQYSLRSESWCMPRAYYTFTAGPVQFFAIDTQPIQEGDASQEAQLRWLDGALAASQVRWKVVYGHHPVFSVGEAGDTPEMVSAVLPILKRHKVDAYVAGHDHDLQYLRPEGSLHFFVAGAGGHNLGKLGKDPGRRRRWAKGKTPGFAVLQADGAGKSLQVSFFNHRNHRLCRVTLEKGRPAVEDCRH